LPPRLPRRSRLFRSRPDALLVDEWVPNITLPPPPDTPLEEEDPATPRLDEHGLPSFEEEPEVPVEARAGPARLFVGMGRRGQSVAPLEAEGDDEDEQFVFDESDGFFVAELRLPRPEDGLPFRSAGGTDDDEEHSSEVLLDAAESSDPSLALSDLEAPFSVSLEAPDPHHLGAFGDEDGDDEEGGLSGGLDDDSDEQTLGEEDSDPAMDVEAIDALVGGGLPPLSLRPSPAREPLARSQRVREEPVTPPPPPPPIVPEDITPPSDASPPRKAHPEVWARPGGAAPQEVAPEPAPRASSRRRGDQVQVLRSRPFFTKERPKKEPNPEPSPLFQPRQVDRATIARDKLVSWTNLGILVAALLIAAALWLAVHGG
jgi:hypothetical protein